MLKVVFVCLGNICRSPMAEYLFSDMIGKRGLRGSFEVLSRATSSEALGCAVHIGTEKILSRLNISCSGKRAEKLKKSDYADYDYFIGMESSNVDDMLRIFGGDADKKVYRLLDFSDSPRDIADPWWTHDFDKTYDDISYGLVCFLNYLTADKQIKS